MSEIRRVGGSMSGMGKNQGVKIVGAQSIDDAPNPEILDRTSPVEPTPVQVVQHEEVVIEDDKVRRPKRDKSEPQVRVRHNDGTFQKAVNDEA